MIGNPVGYPIGGIISTGSAVVGEAAVTLDGVTFAATATIALAADVTKTLDDASLAATGTIAVAASATVTLDDATLAGTGTIALAASLSSTLDDVTLAAIVALDSFATLDVTLDDLSAAGVSDIDIAATDATTLDDATLSATATVGLAGTLDATLDDLGLSFDSTIRLPNTDSDGPDVERRKRRRKSRFREGQDALEKALAKAFDESRGRPPDKTPWLAEEIVLPPLASVPEHNERLASLGNYVEQLKRDIENRKFLLAQEEADIELLLMSL